MPQYIPCGKYASYLVDQEPVYDQRIIEDVRPTNAEWLGYYSTSPFVAFDGVEHQFDRVHDVYPDTTKPWETVAKGACEGQPCDPPRHVIGWGWSRESYGLEKQDWRSPLLCFEEIMTLTKAQAHFAQIIRMMKTVTKTVTSAYIQRRTIELAEKKTCVSPGLPDLDFTWDPGGYTFLNTDCDPTGRLTSDVLQNYAMQAYLLGGSTADENGFSPLQLRTDIDTLRYLTRVDPTLTDAWRIQTFGSANQEYYKYGFNAKVGDYMAKALLFPMRFNKIANGRYQQVLPFRNVAAGEGLQSEPNPDFGRAQYQFSVRVNPMALEVMPFQASAVHPDMPFLIRDYAGKWRFVMDNLGADELGRPIDNIDRNKGMFVATWKLAIKPVHPEFTQAFFHMVDTPCVTIVQVCNTNPGYPDQDTNMAFDPCGCESSITITAVASQLERFAVAANTIRVNGAIITHAAISSTTLAGFVTSLDTAWGTAGLDGTWAVEDASVNKIIVEFAAGETAVESVDIPFLTS